MFAPHLLPFGNKKMASTRDKINESYKIKNKKLFTSSSKMKWVFG
jgi:hypothetical protein